MNHPFVINAARIHTPDGTPATAVAVHEGKVLFVGTPQDARTAAGPDAVILEVPGGTVLPGLVDAHSHVTSGLDSAVGADLSGARDLAEAVARLANEAVGTGPDDWVRGWGLDAELFSGSEITFDAFEEAVSGRASFIKMYDAHSALASTRALALAGVTGGEEFATGSRVVTRSDGTLTGHLLELEALKLVENTIPVPALEDRARRLHILLAEMAATGLTSVHSLSYREEDRQLLEAAEELGDLPLTLVFSPACRASMSREDWASLVELQTVRGRRWRITGIKFFLDGTVENGTAWLSHPDKHGAAGAPAWADLAAYAEAVGYFAAREISTATHAIGDAAVAHALDVLAPHAQKGGVVHRIEHIELASEQSIRSFGRSDVIAGMQPSLAVYELDESGKDGFTRRLGLERRAASFPIREILDAGGVVMLGTDWPSGPFDARVLLADACDARATVRGTQPEAVRSQRLGFDQALAASSAVISPSGRRTPHEIVVGAPATFTVFAGPIGQGDRVDRTAPLAFTTIDGDIIRLG